KNLAPALLLDSRIPQCPSRLRFQRAASSVERPTSNVQRLMNHAPDIEHTARRVIVGAALGERDPAVRDDRTVPVSTATWRSCGDRTGGGLLDGEATAGWVIDECKTAGDDRARASKGVAPRGRQMTTAHRPRRRTRVGCGQ